MSYLLKIKSGATQQKVASSEEEQEMVRVSFAVSGHLSILAAAAAAHVYV